MKILKSLSLILITLITFSGLQAQDIISVKDFLKIQKNDNVVLVSCRKAADYKKVHITGAVHLYHNDLYKDGPVKSMLKPASEIATILGQKGISNDKTIVLYDSGDGKYSGRVYWILDYLGAKDVKILDGHMKAWRAARKPITGNPTQITAANFSAKANTAKIATISEVKKAVKDASYVILDVRSEAEYKGTDANKLRPGHIPSAINLEFKNVMTARSNMKTAEELKIMFTEKGISADKTIILYCESSTRAGIVYNALHSIVKYPNVKVYDGAYLEWQTDAANAVEK